MKEKYLSLLAQQYSSKEAVITEIVNLEAILSLPKGTEHFISDIHGEYDAFGHILRNGSGNVKQKLKDLFAHRLTPEELARLASLIYYPEEKVAEFEKEFDTPEERDLWYLRMLHLLVETTIYCSSKYTRSKVRRAFPPQFAYIMEELIYNINGSKDQRYYYLEVLERICELGQAGPLIIEFCYTVQRFVVGHLHIVGDIYDRGPAPHKIMEELMHYHSADIQWGNHDIIWMGAFCGNASCMAAVVRISARHNNLKIIEDAYGINLRPLASFAERYYNDNISFTPQLRKEEPVTEEQRLQVTKMHQAISVIHFKLEGQLIERRPDFGMSHRMHFNNINFEDLTIFHEGETYPLVNTCFPTVDPKDPYALTPEEAELVEHLVAGFQRSEKLARHIGFLFQKGSLYKNYNGNLLVHGCIPITEEGTFLPWTLEEKTYKGKELLDVFDAYARKGYAQRDNPGGYATDFFWFLWCGSASPLFGKNKMTTFEQHFIPEKKTHSERGNPYYRLRENVEICRYILEGFGLDPLEGRIINGHTPVKEIQGENPMKAKGQCIVIDGGYSPAYSARTGNSGYTLLYNSYGMELVAHSPFVTREEAIRSGRDVISTRRVVDEETQRKQIRWTNIGAELQEKLKDLEMLLAWMESGGHPKKRSKCSYEKGEKL